MGETCTFNINRYDKYRLVYLAAAAAVLLSWVLYSVSWVSFSGKGSLKLS